MSAPLTMLIAGLLAVAAGVVALWIFSGRRLSDEHDRRRARHFFAISGALIALGMVGDLCSGRIVLIANYDTNPRSARDMLERVVGDVTRDYTEKAQQAWQKVVNRYVAPNPRMGAGAILVGKCWREASPGPFSTWAAWDTGVSRLPHRRALPAYRRRGMHHR